MTRLVRPVRIAAVLCAVLVASCGGGGGGGGGGGTTVVISGTITFDRLAFNPTLGAGLVPNPPVQSPARNVVVEAINPANNSAFASTTTDANGFYSLTVPASQNVFIRARAQMLKTDAAPHWNFAVLNNTNSDALYVLDGAAASSGTTNTTRDLRATSGWGTTTYTGPRNAAPFAILDTVYRAKELILTASANEDFPALNLYWSPSNRASVSGFCPDTGNIGTTFYIGSGSDDSCTVPHAVPAGIYILGDFANGVGDTDEFDQNVIAHEFGHYIEDQFSRSDSIGGSHQGGDLLDLRVAFSEGWGDAYSTMVLNDPVYRDSHTGISQDFSFDLENGSGMNGPAGWFSEFSVGEFLWDVFDPANEAGDTVALGFAPIFSVMTGAEATTDALTSIYSFAAGLRSANPAQAAAITTLLNGEAIFGTDAFGAGESNNGGDPTVLPVYDSIVIGTPVPVCSTSTAGSEDANKLGNRRFLRFDNDVARAVTIQAVGISGGVTQDPDIFVHRQGQIVASGTAIGNTETISQQALIAGTHIIEVYDFNVTGTNLATRCMNVSIQGN